MDITEEPKELLACLESICKKFPHDSKEHRALIAAADAIAFVWQDGVKARYSRFIESLESEPSELQLEFLRRNGWLE